MKHVLASASAACLLLAAWGAGAAELTADAVNQASIRSLPQTRPQELSPDPDPAVARLQILLDRAGSSPGVIDGFYGENVSKGVAGFEAMHGLTSDGKLDKAVLDRLSQHGTVMKDYEIKAEDARNLVERIPDDYEKKAEMEHLGFTSVEERLAERFHMDLDLLRTMNPDASFRPGEMISVAVPGEPVDGTVARIEADRKAKQVRAFSSDGKLIAVYPATIGSEENPSPSGTHKVKGVAPMPVYTYRPDVNFQQGDNDEVLQIPGGPNNPVGTIWIDLSEPTYGIHGTPEPAQIDKVGSHGCVRLTNWDAEELGAMVDPGVTVEFVN